MQVFVNPVTILSVTTVGFLFGAIWYSPFLFLNAWLQGEGVSKKETPKRSMRYLVSVNLYSFIAHGCMASVLALMFFLLDISSVKSAISVGLLLALGFIVPPKFIEMLYSVSGNHYSKATQIRFLVASGYYLSVIALMSLCLFYFS